MFWLLPYDPLHINWVTCFDKWSPLTLWTPSFLSSTAPVGFSTELSVEWWRSGEVGDFFWSPQWVPYWVPVFINPVSATKTHNFVVSLQCQMPCKECLLPIPSSYQELLNFVREKQQVYVPQILLAIDCHSWWYRIFSYSYDKSSFKTNLILSKSEKHRWK
jgi:hypothetical protein